MIGYAYTPLFGTALTPQGSVEALAFVIDRSSPSFAELSDAEAAAIIATGRGELGTNLERCLLHQGVEAEAPCLEPVR